MKAIVNEQKIQAPRASSGSLRSVGRGDASDAKRKNEPPN